MRPRTILAAAAVLLAAGLGALAPAPADADVNPLCTWTDTVAGSGRDGVVNAGPYVVAVYTSVEVTCELRVGGPTGPIRYSDTQSTRGSVGVYAGVWNEYLTAGDTFYLCTYTKGEQGGLRTFQGCQYAFTG